MSLSVRLSAHLIQNDQEAIDAAETLAARFREGAAERDRERHLPVAELDEWSRSGLGGITIPRQYGGAQVSFRTLADVFRIVSAADPSLGQIPQNHFGVLGVLHEIGTSEQKRRFYAAILAGERFGNAGPERGTPTILHHNTTLADGGTGSVLHGKRFYSTGALYADWIPTRARDDAGRQVMVIVPRHARGVKVIDDWSSFGQRTTASGSVTFEEVSIEPDNVFPVWQLADRPGITGPVSQLIQAAIDAGIAQAALEDTLAFVRNSARPWVDAGVDRAADDPHLIHAIGRLHTDVQAAVEVLGEAADVIDAVGSEPVTAGSSARASVAVAEAKILTTEVALEAAERLFELAGSSATRASHNLDRHWRNARVHTLHDPVRWKYHAIGNYLLNGVYPRRHQWN